MRKVLVILMAAVFCLMCACSPEPAQPSSSVPTSSGTSSEESALQINTEIPALKTAILSYAQRQGIDTNSTNVTIHITVEQKETENYSITYGAGTASITADCETAAYYAAQDVCKKLLSVGANGLTTETAEDGPVFPMRGVIEGFYGTPWTHQYRLELMEFMGDMKMNSYMYAPKDDQKHLKKWREAYTEEELAKMKELVDAAKANYVNFIYAISPGNDVDFGSGYEQDFATLTAKLQSLYDIGVRHFAILFDDIATKNAEGQTRLLNEFQEKFIKTHEGAADLITVPTEYADILCDSSYAQTFGEKLDKDIEIMWTGEKIVPDSVTKENLALSQQLFKRKVILWWNYPCNDFATNKLFMGAAENLGQTVDDSCIGFLTNPMNQGEASKVPMYTLADYLWNPDTYDAAASQSAACLYVAGGNQEVAKALEFFVEHTSASNTNNYTESTFYKKYADALIEKKPIDTAEAIADFQKLLDMSDTLENSGNRALLGEIDRWLTKLRMYAKLSIAYFQMVDLQEADADAESIEAKQKECRNLIAAIDASDRVVGSTTLLPIKAQIELLLNNVGTGSIIPAKITSDITQYENYVPENATDNDTKTYFWCRDPVEGSHITLDFSDVQHVSSVRLLMGAEGFEKDFVKNGTLQYSADGTTWNDITNVTTATVAVGDLDIYCRYIRLYCNAAQLEWVTVMEFNAYA